MKQYIPTADGPISCVELSAEDGITHAYVHLRNAGARNPVEERLSALGYPVISTEYQGQPLLIVRGNDRNDVLLNTIASIAGPLAEPAEKKPFNAWKIRSLLGFSGQILQLASSVMRRKVDEQLLVFSTANLAANSINLIYEEQTRDDTHQLQVLKQQVNERLAPRLAPGAHAISIHESRAALRVSEPLQAHHHVHRFMQKHSVSVGELGLRYIGALGVAFPMSGWKRAIRNVRFPATNPDAPLRTVAGLSSIFGKTVAAASRIPDPYSPEKPDLLDKIREKYTFVLGGLIEAGAFSALTYDALFYTKPTLRDGVLDTSRSLKIGGKYQRDWLSAIGSALFVGGYIVRSWAKYGKRQVNLPELYAHASDMLVQVTPEQLPKATAEIAGYLADHLKTTRPELTYGVIHEAITQDLERHHGVTLDAGVKTAAPAGLAEKPVTRVDAKSAAHQSPPSPHGQTQTKALG